MKRALALRSEHLSELTTDELVSVAGGSLTGVYPTIDRSCPTVQGCIDIAPLPTTNCFTGTSGHTVTCHTFGC